jgi:hypothetical protein
MGVPIVLLALAGTFCRNAPQPAPKAATGQAAAPRKAEPVKILQFYASEVAVARGERVLLCYSVENAQSVSLTPEVDRVYPAYSRCVQATPSRTTTYTFTAEGADGSKATKSVVVQVQGSAASPTGLRIKYFEPRKKEDFTLLCYAVDNAESVEITPNVLPASSIASSCLGVAPREATTYTLTASGPDGRKIQRTLTVKPE